MFIIITANLGVVDFGAFTASDCRTEWPPATTASDDCGCCCTYTVGPNAEYTSIQTAINALPATGGEICIQPGIYYEHIFLNGLIDVVIQGCGWQTRIASPSLNPAAAVTGAAPGSGTAAGSSTSASTTTTLAPPFAAVITVSGSQHIELRDFCVEAADSEAGILLDGTGSLGFTLNNQAPLTNPLVIDATIKDLVLTASTLPAILADPAELLRIDRNRIAMKNVQSQWPAVWVSGREIHIDHNWVGIQTGATTIEWLPASVATDLNPPAPAPAAVSGAPASTDTTDDVAGASATGAVFAGRTTVDTKAFKSKTGKKTDETTVPKDTTAAGISTGSPFASVSAPKTSALFTAAGGIQIAGPSRDVFVIENEIEGGSANGITLGSLITIDSNGNPTGGPIGVYPFPLGPCPSDTPPGEVPPSSGSGGTSLVSGGPLENIQIDRNVIANMGLCGIGPVGLFDLTTVAEVIIVENLTICANEITNTLLKITIAINEVLSRAASSVGLGAICLPLVQNAILRDNSITNFGAQPGLEVCGVYVLCGEMVEISRNHVIDTRDWPEADSELSEPANGKRGGIYIALVGLAAFSPKSSAWSKDPVLTPIFEPGIPALRIEHNVVRVPLSKSLYALGLGPFSIVNNHLSCGGTITSNGTTVAQTVLILNLGTAIELLAANTFTASHASMTTSATNAGIYAMNPRTNSSSGAVLFVDNVCQLSRRAGGQPGYANVLIFSLDNLVFGNNHLWVDGPPITSKHISAALDAMLLAGSIQVNSNRFQESAGFPVLASGITYGVVNITSLNISTYCLFVAGGAGAVVNQNNISLLSVAAVAAGQNDPCAQ